MKTIEMVNARARKPEWSMAEPVNFCLEEGEHIAIVGRNGAGKSMFVDMLTGRHPAFPDLVKYAFDEPYNNLKHITFRDTYGGDNDRTYFLQQRWNQMEIDEETPTVGQKLEEAYRLAGEDSLFTHPKVLIMENPFIGLDAETRDQLKELLGMLAKEQGLQIILVLAKTDEIPDFITHIVEVKDLRVLPKVAHRGQPLCNSVANAPYSQQGQSPCAPADVIHFNHVTIRYGERTILKDLDWTVKKGEHWSLSGQNGSGKSTLLSLVCADNPQSYACDISLFGHKRGSGESIWDIKRHIGYVSPEMHRSYSKNIPAIEIVASGLKDTIGLYSRPNEAEKEQCLKWMKVFGIGHLEERKFMEMSSGEQRLVLLARAFVKEPDLLILDEPLHGLDDENRKMVKAIVDEYCQDSDVTLIYVTHYQNELPMCIDNSLYLRKN